MKISRRTFLKTTAATIGGASAFRYDQSPAFGQSPGNPIAIENQQSGTPGWFTTNPARTHQIEGYASQVSAIAGDNVQLFVSTTTTTYTVSLYRLGWYGGVGARLIAQYGPLTGMVQAIPTPDPTTGLVECQWQSQLSVPISSSWTTGSYLFRLERPDGLQSYIPLVIRAPQSTGSLVFECSTTTYQAYNQWGGESLYYTATGAPARNHAYVVSFDRPYDYYDDHAPGAGQALLWEYPTIRWLEMQGYNLSYTTDNDTHTNGASLLNCQVYLSVGHDEYWSRPMYDAVQAARDAGVHLLFFGANTCYWQIRFAASASGNNRRIIGYKEAAYTQDPLYGVNNALVTTLWRDPLLNRPENGMIGVQYEGYEEVIRYSPLNLTLAGDPEFAAITVSPLQSAPAITGYEYDSAQNNGAAPPGMEILANSVLINARAMPDVAQSARYIAPSGARVFGSGTIGWGWGLDSWQTLVQGLGDQTNSAVQQLTAILLNDALLPASPTGAQSLAQMVQIVPMALKMAPGQTANFVAAVGGLPQAAVTWSIYQPSNSATVDNNGNVFINPATPAGTIIHLTATSVQYPTSSAQTVITVSVPTNWNIGILAGNADSGYVDGPAGTAQFVLPAGLCVDGQGNIYLADTDGDAIRKISGGNVSTLAGQPGAPGDANNNGGPTGAALFSHPFGVSYANGEIYVADAFNNAIRTVGAGGAASTLAGTGQAGFLDGPATQAQFHVPTNVTLDPFGCLYIADTANHAIRRISPDGDVSTVAGTGQPGLIDGPLGQSHLNFPYGLAWTNSGLVIADTGNHAIRLLNSSNVLTTIAGNGVMGYADGTAAIATFNCPVGVLPMPGGAIWITDHGNNVVRSLDPVAGSISTVLGAGVAYQATGGDLTAQFLAPVSLAFGPDGSMYLSDYTFVYHITSMRTATTVAYLNILPSMVPGSMTATATVTLDGIAAVNTVVSLSTTNNAATVPSSVTIPVGSMSITFPITTQTVASIVTGNVTASLNGVNVNSYLAVRPISVLSLALNPSSIIGGTGVAANLLLEAPAAPGAITITLSSSSPYVAVPASITIPAGGIAAPFVISTQAVASIMPVSITATANGRSITRTLTLKPPVPVSVSVQPSTVPGGLTATGTVTLSNSGIANQVVALSTTNSAAALPATVTVPAGSTSANFTITTQAVTSVVNGSVIATANNITVNTLLAVRPIRPLSLVLNPSAVVGGQGSTATVTLEGPAAPGSITVTFTGSDGNATAPSVTIPAGSTTATVNITTLPVISTDVVTITATGNSGSLSRTLTVQPVGPASVAVNPYTVLGGQSAVGTLNLNQASATALTIALSSSDPSASVPTSITVPAGSTTATFTITTQAVSSTTSPVITASANGVAVTGNMAVRPMGPASLAISPSTVTGGQSATATVTLEAPAVPGSITVTFNGSDGNASVPSITIPAGSTTGTATITTLPVSSTDVVTITATANGRSTSRTLTVQPIAPTSVTINPSTVAGSLTATGTVTLGSVAATNTIIALSSSNSAATVPTTVTVPAGSSSASFTVATQAVLATVTGNITATASGVSVNGYIAVRPLGPLSLAFSPSTVTAPQSATGTIMLEAPAAPGSLVATLTGAIAGVLFPVSVIIPAGSTTATFSIATTKTASGNNDLITVTVNGRATSKTLTIH